MSGRRVLLLLAAAAACVAGGGWLLAVTWHLSLGTGLYCAVGHAATVGCNPALDGAAQVASVLVMLTAIPLLAAVFAWATGRHAGLHVREHLEAAERRIAADADTRHVVMQRHVERLLKGHCADLKAHVSAVAADGPVRGGPGSNPGSEGLPAETAGTPDPAGPVVPPPAAAERVEIIPLEPKKIIKGRRGGERM